ncbi:nucleoside hydrolase [Nocardia sp. NPDC005366]|uniref:nucleoside hydrolase n=1 Tax=Nocardia sp. NPDC005366 TaxID=3156878 RepID=UPI0033AF9FC3
MNLVVAARTVPPGQLVVLTSDEIGGLRARFAREMLDSLGRSEVEVIEGIDLGHERRILADPGQVVPEYVYPDAQEREDRFGTMVAALTEAIDSAEGPVRWVGCGSMAELATLLTWAPHLAEQLVLTQMGGWLRTYRDLTRASHNFRIDAISAGLALRTAHRPRLVMSEHTNHDAIRVTDQWALIDDLAADSAPQWARMLGIHFQRWFAFKDGGCWLHDPLTLSAALGLPFVSFAEESVRIGEDARLYADPYGRAMKVSASVDYAGFLDWVHEALTW